MAWVALGVEIVRVVGAEAPVADVVTIAIFYLGVGLDLVFGLVRRLRLGGR